MIIQNSNISTMSSSSYQKSTSSRVFAQDDQGNEVALTSDQFLSYKRYDKAEISSTTTDKNAANSAKDTEGDSAMLMRRNSDDDAGIMVTKSGKGTDRLRDVQEMKMELLERMIEALRGKKGYKKSARNMSLLSAQRINGSQSMSIGRDALTMTNRGGRAYEAVQESAVYEKESMSFAAKGIVNTADGKQISVDVNLNMSREAASYIFESIGEATVKSKKPIDPIVVNFNGTGASLTDEKFSFDLDVDGKEDMISFAGEGSGFLALDKNNDGKINDGSELFGPQSGNGFEELRKYDLDKNGWIDEADDIYSKLKVWTRDKDGNEQLLSLKDLDVGAIYLNEAQTNYGLYDSQGNAQGIMRSTSIFLRDSGGAAGTLSHIDILA